MGTNSVLLKEQQLSSKRCLVINCNGSVIMQKHNADKNTMHCISSFCCSYSNSTGKSSFNSIELEPFLLLSWQDYHVIMMTVPYHLITLTVSSYHDRVIILTNDDVIMLSWFMTTLLSLFMITLSCHLDNFIIITLSCYHDNFIMLSWQRNNVIMIICNKFLSPENVTHWFGRETHFLT
jgi:hypothetical protein